jgi:hypothetical protein
MAKKTFMLGKEADNLDESLLKVMEFLDGLTPEDDVRIYMYSWGWAMWWHQAILARLNELIDSGHKITIHLLYAASAALILIWQFKGKIICEADAECIAHITAIDFWPVFGQTLRTNDPMDRIRHAWYGKEPQIQFSFMTPEEQKHYNEWGDVWINPERTRIIFHNRIHPCSIDSSTLSSCAGPVLSSSGTETTVPWNWLSTPQEPESGIPEQLPT